jgi:hypothetical protein
MTRIIQLRSGTEQAAPKPTDRFHFDRFVRGIESDGLAGLIQAAVNEARWADAQMIGDGAHARIAADGGAERFRDAIGRLLSWLRADTISHHSTPEDFEIYRRVAKRLSSSCDFTSEDGERLEQLIADHYSNA